MEYKKIKISIYVNETQDENQIGKLVDEIVVPIDVSCLKTRAVKVQNVQKPRGRPPNPNTSEQNKKIGKAYVSRVKERYATDLVFREQWKAKAKEAYRKKKALRNQNLQIIENQNIENIENIENQNIENIENCQI